MQIFHSKYLFKSFLNQIVAPISTNFPTEMPTLMSTASPGSRMESAEAASTPEGILTEVEGARRAANCRDSDVVAMMHKFRDDNPGNFT